MLIFRKILRTCKMNDLIAQKYLLHLRTYECYNLQLWRNSKLTRKINSKRQYNLLQSPVKSQVLGW